MAAGNAGYGRSTIQRTAAAIRGLLVSVCAVCCLAPALAHADDDFLAPEVAFQLSAQVVDASTIALTYIIADGYYLYRERFAFSAEDAVLGKPDIPAGKIKFDDTFQKNVETYRHAVTIRVPVQAAGPFTLLATSQGCSDKGLCYPPMTLKRSFDAGMSALIAANQGASNANAAMIDLPDTDGSGKIARSLRSGKLLIILPLFFLLGLGLAFTPCVLPMLPILSGIIVGEGAQVTRARGLLLAATYALGMAVVYTLLGIAAGLAGEGLAAALQNPWVLSAFALLMVALALAMFDVYQLQMPAAVQSRLTQASGRQSGGKLIGVFIMGALSALIVGPCVAAPLAGALVYISQTRDVIVGGSALFALAVGMSVPLLLLGVSAGALLPRAGAWMNAVKRFFGVLMLAVALWMVSPVIPAAVQMLGWAMLGIGYGAYLLWAGKGGWFARALGIFLLALGVLQLIGMASGGRNVLTPLAHFDTVAAEPVSFKRVKTVADLDALLAQANGKNVMLDFYADWCVSCIEMEKLTFTDPRVRAQLKNMLLLQADVTANDAQDKAMLKRFDLFGPPGFIFFDRQGGVFQGGRVIGFQKADKFAQVLEAVARYQQR
jgi:thiol:disulfide interchange protein DsbD